MQLFSTLELLTPPIAPARSDDWKARMITIYQQQQQYEAGALRQDLARRLRVLTGAEVPSEQIWVEPAERYATVLVDGVRFRYEQGRLTILRPCALCGLGEFASPLIETSADVGYALSAWAPHHPNCHPDDPANWLDS